MHPFVIALLIVVLGLIVLAFLVFRKDTPGNQENTRGSPKTREIPIQNTVIRENLWQKTRKKSLRHSETPTTPTTPSIEKSDEFVRVSF